MREDQQKRQMEYELAMIELRKAKLEDRREVREEAEKVSKVAKAKRFGDAIRNSTFRMGNDPIYHIALFEYIEKLCGVYQVPDDMKVTLMRPFLNEKATSLLTPLDAETPAIMSVNILHINLSYRLVCI